MNSNNKDKARIIKKALLFSKKPTKKEVCFFIFFHALMVALIVVGVLSRNPLLQLMGMGGAFWFAIIARQVVIDLTDNSDRYIWQVVNRLYRRTNSQAINDALLGLLIFAVAMLMLFGFTVVAVVSGLLWLIYIGIGIAIAIIVAYTVWYIWTIARQVKAQRRQEETA